MIDVTNTSVLSILIPNTLKEELGVLKDNNFNKMSNSKFFEMVLDAGLNKIKKSTSEWESDVDKQLFKNFNKTLKKEEWS